MIQNVFKILIYRKQWIFTLQKCIKRNFSSSTKLMIIHFLRVWKFVWWGKKSYYLQSNFLDILEPNFTCWCWRQYYTIQRRVLSYQKLNGIQYFFSLDHFDPTQCKYWYNKYSLKPYWQSILYISAIDINALLYFTFYSLFT